MIFNKNKFKSFCVKKKHKKCAELLKIIYEKMLIKESFQENISHYNELLLWMQLSIYEEKSINNIADRYHWHLNQTDLSLKEHNLLPSIRKIDKPSKEEFLSNLIYLDNLRSAFNVGNILRTTEALRIGSICFGTNTPFIDNDKVQKTSMGSYSIVPCYKEIDLDSFISPVIGIDTGNEAIPLYDFIFPKQFTLVLGNEEYGISDTMLKKIDYLIEIPMPGFKNSINVASAYAMVASEIKRQKRLQTQT
jgi:tRNA G18 (ribose-2'-O)-methylase SpoU